MSNLLKQTLTKNANKHKFSSGSEDDAEGENEDQMGELGAEAPKIGHQQFDPLDHTQYFPIVEYLNDKPIYFMKGDKELIILCLHGAGLSSASFSLLATKIRPFGSCAAFDFPSHGLSKADSQDPNLSIDKLIADSEEVIGFLLEKHKESTLIILGHSLGGSVAAKVAHRIGNGNTSINKNLISRVVGLVVVDVVEGSAIDALPFMKDFVIGRPKFFASQDEAIKYVVKSKSVNNLFSARISTPNQLVKRNNRFEWKIDLLKTEKYWQEWFKGLNASFLSTSMPKILILAHPDRMDKELTIAQMQGKFKLIVLTSFVGHIIHEDDPDQMADQLLAFLKQFRIPLDVQQLQQLKNEGIGKFHNGL